MNLLIMLHVGEHAAPRFAHALAALPDPWRVATLVAPPLPDRPQGGASSRYDALAARLSVTNGAPTKLDALLRYMHLEPREAWGRVVLCSWSAGYALAWALLDSPGVDGWIGLDSGYADRDPDGTAADARLEPAVRFVRRARAGEVVCYFGHTQIRTSYASTAEVAAELQRLGGEPAGLWRVESWPGADAHAHEAALLEHGPPFVTAALEALGAASERPTAPMDQAYSVSGDLRTALVEVFRAALAAGIREEGGPNRGPEVEAYLDAVGLGPGQPWCAAMVSAEGEDAALAAGVRWPLPLSGAVHILVAGARAAGRWHALGDGYTPEAGDLPIYGRAGERPDRGGRGHVGVLVDAVAGRVVSGNLDDRVLEHGIYQPARGLVLIGWISLAA